jgi:dipeptidyl aminopeptidase/acylaminoacyl peptidase
MRGPSTEMPTVAGYGTWSSPITAEAITVGQVGLAQPSLDRGDGYWLETRPQEAGRTVLVRRTPAGRRDDLTPAPLNVRTRVHEYGGGAYAVRDGVIVAANFADQRVYRIDGGTAARPLTPESAGQLRYADMELDLARGRVLAVREDHRAGGEAINAIVAVPLTGGDEGWVIVHGHDFFSSPRLSPDGKRLTWLSWDHPNLPWDGTHLWSAEITSAGSLNEVRLVAGGERESIVQPAWSPDNQLYFVSDTSGWWNLYRADADSASPVCPMSAEFAGPAWTFGMRWYGFLDPATILACFSEGGRWHLGTIDVGAGRLDRLALAYTEFSGLAVEDGRAILRAGRPDRPAAIILLDPASGSVTELCTAGDLPVDPSHLARPQAIAFPSEGGAITHAFYYSPSNPDFRAPAGELPPLIVKSHGGPTGSTSSELRLPTQFWTSRGFAVCDVNYGGSTGYGRVYRERLNGRWGEVDVLDCVAAALFLVAKRKADARRLAITGGSAGGYTTLCALTFHDAFRAGASHYGVSDLGALARDTHKFESRYLDRLVGPWPEAAAVYRARSPIHHVERLSCPIIFFQGLEDAVVPPNQAELMVDALRRKGLPVAYLTFPGEQHGFRKAETIQTVLSAELAFYGRIFGFTTADGLADLAIDNL